jgi:hypothetical protein
MSGDRHLRPKTGLIASSNLAAAVGWSGEFRFSQQFGLQSQHAGRRTTANQRTNRSLVSSLRDSASTNAS